MTQELATTNQKQSLLVSMAEKYQMDPGIFQATIKATVMPSKATNEQMAAFLLVANQYDLNPITREIHAFPATGGGITAAVGIDGWINLAQRRKEFDGMEFSYEHDEHEKPISCTCRIFRKDRSRPVEVTEFMDECRRNTGPWNSHPRRMLRHKAVIQAIRYAFGFSGIKDEDDAEIIAEQDEKSSITVTDLKSRIEKRIEHEPQWPIQVTDTETGEQYWQDSRGIAHSPNVHGTKSDGTPAVTINGHFTKRRGCDPLEHARYEKEALAAQSDPQAEPEQSPVQTAQDAQAPGYTQVMHAIQAARNEDDLANAEDLLNGFAGPDDQRAELAAAVETAQACLVD